MDIRKFMKKYLFIFLGTICLCIGIVGLLLPLLPTTPLLLLASFFYIRSSKRLYYWLIRHNTFGPYIYNYMTYRAVKLSTKIIAILSLWLSLLISIWFIQNLYIRLLLCAIGIGVSIYLISLNTISAKKFAELSVIKRNLLCPCRTNAAAFLVQ